MINLRLLTAINVAMDDEPLLDTIDALADYLADGTISAECDGDAVIRLRLTDAGRALMPAMTLPWTGA
jgi:hypothetical protein